MRSRRGTNLEDGKMKCPHCGKAIKGHAKGTKSFRDLNKAQRRASIAKQSRDLKEAKEIHRRMP